MALLELKRLCLKITTLTRGDAAAFARMELMMLLAFRPKAVGAYMEQHRQEWEGWLTHMHGKRPDSNRLQRCASRAAACRHLCYLPAREPSDERAFYFPDCWLCSSAIQPVTGMRTGTLTLRDEAAGTKVAWLNTLWISDCECKGRGDAEHGIGSDMLKAAQGLCSCLLGLCVGAAEGLVPQSAPSCSDWQSAHLLGGGSGCSSACKVSNSHRQGVSPGPVHDCEFPSRSMTLRTHGGHALAGHGTGECPCQHQRLHLGLEGHSAGKRARHFDTLIHGQGD